jgi:hypothetical protein
MVSMAAAKGCRAEQGERLFSTVERGLTSMFETMALCDAINVPCYGEPTSRSTIVDRVSFQDRLMDAVHIKLATKATISDVQYAWATSAYDGMGKDRVRATDTLCAAFAGLHKNAELLRAVIEREFDHGETWCASFRDIARDFGVSKDYAARMGKKVQDAVSALRVETLAILKAAFEAKGWITGRDRV